HNLSPALVAGPGSGNDRTGRECGLRCAQAAAPRPAPSPTFCASLPGHACKHITRGRMQMMYPQISAKTHWLVALVAGTSLALSACGGDSSSRRAPPPDHTELSGTAAIGAPITSGTVIARCADGSGF